MQLYFRTPLWGTQWGMCLQSWGMVMSGLMALPSCLLCSARSLEKAQQQLQDEVRQVSAQLLEERKKRETHEALARRLQKRNVLLTKVQFTQHGQVPPRLWLSIFIQPSVRLHVLACGPFLTPPAGIPHLPDHRPGTVLAFPSGRL